VFVSTAASVLCLTSTCPYRCLQKTGICCLSGCRASLWDYEGVSLYERATGRRNSTHLLAFLGNLEDKEHKFKKQNKKRLIEIRQ